MKSDEIQVLLDGKDREIQELMLKLEGAKRQTDEILLELSIIRQEQVKLIKNKQDDQKFDCKSFHDDESSKLLQECRQKVGIVTCNKKMLEVIRMAKKVADTDCSVLILGESGTGKELIARYIHNCRPQEKGRFVAVNTTAIPRELMESEFFGYKKGAFSGADYDKDGYFKTADHGTIFLDEIGDSNPLFQAKLLRVLDDGEYRRVGDPKLYHTSARIEAATTKDLESEVKKGNFLEEFFHRIDGVRLELPPLRERQDDIELLADYFIDEYNRRYNRNILGPTENALREIKNYHWPGNVREFEKTISRAIVLADGNLITEADLGIRSHNNEIGEEQISLITDHDEDFLALLARNNFEISKAAHEMGHERNYVASHFKGLCLKALTECDWDVKNAAKSIENNESNLIRVEEKIKEYYDNTVQELHDCISLEDVQQLMGKKFKNIPKRFHKYIIKIYEKKN